MSYALFTTSGGTPCELFTTSGVLRGSLDGSFFGLGPNFHQINKQATKNAPHIPPTTPPIVSFSSLKNPLEESVFATSIDSLVVG